MPASEFDENAWRERIDSFREEKNQFFGDHPQSPIPPAERDDFDGLAYFDPAPDYRVVARVEFLREPEERELEMTAGPSADYTRTATLGFTLDGNHYTLAAYRVEGESGLFIPFADETNGDETYERGRYLEVDVDGVESGDEVVLDFNLAYSPFCAYSDTYACPIPPSKNDLPVEIRAGEKLLEF